MARKAQILKSIGTDTYPAVQVQCSCGNKLTAYYRSWAGNGKVLCKKPKGCGKAIEFGTLEVKDSDQIKAPTSVRHSTKKKPAKKAAAKKAAGGSGS